MIAAVATNAPTRGWYDPVECDDCGLRRGVVQGPGRDGKPGMICEACADLDGELNR